MNIFYWKHLRTVGQGNYIEFLSKSSPLVLLQCIRRMKEHLQEHCRVTTMWTGDSIGRLLHSLRPPRSECALKVQTELNIETIVLPGHFVHVHYFSVSSPLNFPLCVHVDLGTFSKFCFRNKRFSVDRVTNGSEYLENQHTVNTVTGGKIGRGQHSGLDKLTADIMRRTRNEKRPRVTCE